MAGEGHAVERACRITGVSHAGYYMWRLRAPSERAIRHAWLLDQIIEVHAASRGTYGARRVHAELTLGRGVKVGHNAVEMLMSRAQIYGLPGPKRRKKVPRAFTPTDLVDRDSPTWLKGKSPLAADPRTANIGEHRAVPPAPAPRASYRSPRENRGGTR